MSKNIWIINHYANAMYQNEGGRHYWFAEELIKRGYKVSIICSNQFHAKNKTIETKGNLYKKVIKKDISFYFVKTVSSQGNGAKRVLNMLMFFRNLMKSYKDITERGNNAPDIIIGSSVHPLSMVAGVKIGKKLKVPAISEVRDLWPEAIFAFNKAKENGLLGKVLINGEKWIYNKSDAIIFTKEGDVDYIKERNWDSKQGGPINLEKCFYINNGVNNNGFQQSIINNQYNDQDLENPNTFKVVYAGALRPVNDVNKLVEAARILKEHNEIQFLIYGQGIEEERLKQKIAEYGLNNIKLKGFINKNQIPYTLSNSDLNILNYSQSRYNWSRGNSSNKLFEYMASGKPIISNVKMGYCILSKYHCGVVTEDNSPEALAKSILSIFNLNKDDYKVLCNNSILAAYDFDYEKLTSKLESVINFVLENRKDKLL